MHLTKIHKELSNDLDFISNVNQYIRLFQISEIIETGTYLGTGSTIVFAKTGLPVKTVECNQSFALKAKKNLENYKNVNVINGLSLFYDDCIKYIRERNYIFSKDIQIDSMNPVECYSSEIINTNCQNLLPSLCDNIVSQIIFLDSSGGIGKLEFEYIINLPSNIKSTKVLILDDINHVKHYESWEKLLTIGYSPYVSQDQKWLICKL